MTEQTATVDAASFAALDLHPALLDALSTLGYEEPTPIQQAAIPPLLAGRDLLGQAATGTGKTAAFALPIIQHIGKQIEGESRNEDARPSVRALVLVPTRELAIQVAEAIHRYGRALGIRVLPIYGGQAIQQQLRALRRGVHVVVATPGRALDHIRRRTLELDHVSAVVLDEADEMLDMGFAEDLEAILESVPEERQTALLSATIPPRIAAIARRHLRDPVHVRIARELEAPGEMPRVRQVAYVVRRQHKVSALGRVLDMEAPTLAIIFCRTRTEVDELTETLGTRGYRAEAMHGGFSQEQRDRVMRRFRSGAAELLIATDVAARGLDIENVSHVINFDVPSAPDAYVHRIGRTGRAGREGVAITLAEPREHRLLRNIEQVTRQSIHVQGVPTIHDLRARRLELTRAALQEVLLAGDLDEFRVVVETLAGEFDVMDVATAAVKLAHQAAGAEAANEDIPAIAAALERGSRRPESGSRQDAPRRRKREGRERDIRRRDGRETGSRETGSRETGGRETGSRETGSRETGSRKAGGRVRDSRPRIPRAAAIESDVTRLYIGLGRRAGVRPADLVGAIANEAGIDSRVIGAIDIADGFSLVEVPESDAPGVISALRGTTIRGKRVVVRREREAR